MFGKKKVGKVLSTFNKALADLQAIVETNRKENEALNEKMDKLLEEKRENVAEILHANRAISNIKAIIE